MDGAVIPRGYPVLDKQNGVKNSNQMSITWRKNMKLRRVQSPRWFSLLQANLYL